MPTITPTPTIVQHIPILEEEWTAPASTPLDRYPDPMPDIQGEPRVVVLKQIKKPGQRNRPQQGLCRKGHPMTPENVYNYSSGKRRCKSCHLQRCAEYRKK